MLITNEIIILRNTLSIVNILLICSCIMDCSFMRKIKQAGMAAGVFFLFNNLLELSNALSNARHYAIVMAGIVVYMLFLLIINMPAGKWKSGIYLFAGILIYMQCTSVAAVVGEVFRLNRYPALNLADAGITYYDLAVEILLIVIVCRINYMIDKRKMVFVLNGKDTFFLIFFCSFFIFYDVIYQQLYIWLAHNDKRFVVCLAWAAFSVILTYSVFHSVWSKKVGRHYMEIAAVYEKYLEAEYRGFQEYKEYQKNLDKLRHDMKNHFLAVSGLLEQHKYGQAQSYLAEIQGIAQTGCYPALTGNEMADIIIGAKYRLIKEGGIAFRFEGSFGDTGRIQPREICILLANALDNAIEACMEVEGERFIRIVAGENENHVCISVVNSVKNIRKSRNGRFLSTKKEKSLHGIGMQNMREVLGRYNGEMFAEQSDGQFRVDMIFEK